MDRVGTWPHAGRPIITVCSLVLSSLLLSSLTITVGCGGRDAESQIAAANDSNLRRIGNLYKAYQLRHGNKGPGSEEEFKTFLHQMPPVRLERMQVDPGDIDGLFISEEDGQPFVIRYGVDGGLGTSEAVVFEQNGSGGKRQVGFTDGSVEDVDASRYEQLLQGDR